MIYLGLGVFFLIALICKWIFIDKLRIKWYTFKGKGFRPVRGDFGLYTYTGNQGKGKTYSLVEYIVDKNKNIVVFSNVKGIKNVDRIKYYNGFEGLVQCKKDLDKGLYDDFIKDYQIIFLYDELFTELTKNTRLSLEVQDFLCQLRKRKIIFLTTAQVWSEIPIYFRKLCRFQINCNMIPFLNTGFLIKEFRDAENMKWDEELQDHVAPTLELSFSKVRKKISSSYDTLQRITNDYKDVL